MESTQNPPALVADLERLQQQLSELHQRCLAPSETENQTNRGRHDADLVHGS